jgi:hypothetical protein
MKLNFLHKTKETKTFLGKCLQTIIFNNMFRILFFAILTILGGIFFNISNPIISEISYYILIIGAIGSIIHLIIFMIYAWIINPIQSLKNNKK